MNKCIVIQKYTSCLLSQTKVFTVLSFWKGFYFALFSLYERVFFVVKMSLKLQIIYLHCQAITLKFA